MKLLMEVHEAITAIRGGQPIVIETRKYGITANWYTTRDKAVFSDWLRTRQRLGNYMVKDYGKTWRAWKTEPTDEQRRGTEWR